MSTLTRRLAMSGGLAVAAVAIAVPLTAGPGTATAAPAAVTQQADLTLAAFGLGTGATPGKRVPEALKADLKAAWARPDGQRVAALQAVLDKAAGGAYGEQVATRATKVQARLAAMNPQLRSDLLAAIELPQDQRRAALKQIKAKAKAGEYGELRGKGRLPGLLRHRG